MLLVPTTYKPAQRQQPHQRRHTGNLQPANPGGVSNGGGRCHCIRNHGLRLYLLEFSQLGLQLGQLLFLAVDQLILALQLRIEFIDCGLKLVVLQGAGSQLFDSGINHGDVSCWRRPCHGWRRFDRLNPGECRRRGTGNRFIGGGNNAWRPRWIDQHRVLAQ
ncbi:hypothetical protein D3C87_1692170 [compost metagenome]